jgi:DNA mismatch repair protein MutS
MKMINTKFGNLMNEVVKRVSLVDFYCSGAECAVKRRFFKPIITDTEESYINAVGLRHPLVEVMNNKIFIPNDIYLGNNNQNGILLYGLNAAGKTTLARSIGIAVVLAQMGYFVPTKELTLTPFKSIFTRIGDNDNLFKGLSSFSYEISELRAIINRSSQHTLVIGDEICKSTHLTAQQVIFMTMLKMLNESQTRFLFCTHLHEILGTPAMDEITNMEVYHLGAYYDTELKTIVYERKLKKGPCNNNYGLDVAKYLINDHKFNEISRTMDKMLNGVTHDVVTEKTSRYNSKKIVNECEITKRKPQHHNDHLETHHIIEQSEADENGYLTGDKYHVHKNHVENLMVVSEEVHDMIHNNEIIVEGYVDTLKGKKLKVTKQKKEIVMNVVPMESVKSVKSVKSVDSNKSTKTKTKKSATSRKSKINENV